MDPKISQKYVFPLITSVSFKWEATFDDEDHPVFASMHSFVSFPDLKAYHIESIPKTSELVPLVLDATQNIRFLEFDITNFITANRPFWYVSYLDKPEFERLMKVEYEQRAQVLGYLDNVFQKTIPWLQIIKNMRSLKRLYAFFANDSKGSEFLFAPTFLRFKSIWMQKGWTVSKALTRMTRTL